MAANKENVAPKFKSRLPVRIDRQTLRPVQKQGKPHPLKTLTSINVDNCAAGPSQRVGKLLNTKLKTKDEDLDWKLDVFKDNKTNDHKPEKSDKLTVDINQGSLDTTPVVPIKTPTDLSTLKKNKKCLKRPASKELKVIKSPVSARADRCSISSHAEVIEFLTSPGLFHDWSLNRSYALDNLNYLMKTESKLAREPNIRNALRSGLINWMINVNGRKGNPAVVQLAGSYFDSFLRVSWVSMNLLQVVSAACYWIAAKIHGYKISSRRLVMYSRCAFFDKELVTVEREVLKRLKFSVLPVTPHDFVPYLSWCCADERPGIRVVVASVEAAAVFLCQCGVMIDKTLGKEYPSVIAAAAVKNALILLRQNHLIDKLKACSIYKSAEKKASNMSDTCIKLREAVRVVSSASNKNKAPLINFSGPPHLTANRIVIAVNSKEILRLDRRKRASLKRN